MLLPLALAAYAFSTPCRSIGTVNLTGALEVPVTITRGTDPLCFAVPAQLEGGTFTVSARAAATRPSRLCLTPRWTNGDHSTVQRTVCGQNPSVVSRVEDAGQVFSVMPYDASGGISGLQVILTVAFTSATESNSHGIRGGSFCEIQRSNLLYRCERPATELCPHATTDIEVMSCLSTAATGRERRLIDAGCEYAMRGWSDCIYGPHLLVPMEVASFLLLAAASCILLCAVVRCCCRFLCFRSIVRRELHGSRAESLVDADSDAEADEEMGMSGAEVGLAPLRAPSAADRRGGGGAVAKAAGEAQTAEDEAGEEDDALPTYSDAVDGATVLPRDPS